MFHTRQSRTFDGVEYAVGAVFEVQVPARLSGMVAKPGYQQGWGQQLQPGDLVTCTGFGPGWGSDPGYGLEFTTEASQEARAFHCQIRPSTGGVFAYRPAIGVLRPVPAAVAD